MSQRSHSEDVLTDVRDRWWSSDFLALVVSRLGLGSAARVLDLGCGQGHWGQRLLPLLDESATLVGVDLEREWVERATERAQALGLGARCDYRVGTLEELPLDDSDYDLVTCQTVLMHVAEPRVALLEMLRVLKPGGRLLLSEPNNVAQQFIADSSNRALTPEQLGSLFTLFTACSRGRAKLGRGDDCVGDQLPTLLLGLELEGVQVFQNERAAAILPPYSSEDRAQLEQTCHHAERGFWLWNEADARLLYEAGGGDLAAFTGHYGAFVARTEIFKAQVRDGSYASNNGSLHYLVSATRRLPE